MLVVFVCTGNICRSPMAEAMARTAHAGRGLTFASAGTFGLNGHAMTPRAATALGEIGIGDEGHGSKQVDADLVAAADIVYVMEPQHMWWLVDRWPDAAGKIHLLDPEGRSVADPYGGSLETYRASRDHIGAALAERARDWSNGV